MSLFSISMLDNRSRSFCRAPPAQKPAPERSMPAPRGKVAFADTHANNTKADTLCLPVWLYKIGRSARKLISGSLESSAPEQREQQDHRKRDTEQPQQCASTEGHGKNPSLNIFMIERKKPRG